MVNSELKAQIEELRQERQQLMVMLNLHRPTCIVRTDSVKTPESEANPLLEQLSADAKWNEEAGETESLKCRLALLLQPCKRKHNWQYISKKALELCAEDFRDSCPKTWGCAASLVLLHELALSIGGLEIPSFISALSVVVVVVDTHCA